MGREVVNIRSSDMVAIPGGRCGTLREDPPDRLAFEKLFAPNPLDRLPCHHPPPPACEEQRAAQPA